MKIVTRETALAGGLLRYFTGETCRHGHVAKRLVSNKSRLTCATRRKLAWAASNKDKLAARKRAVRAANPDKVRHYERGRYQSDSRVKMLSAAKQRAKLKGVEFNITIDDIKIPAVCPLLGMPLTVGNGVMGENSPTLDRIKNDAGYVPGNIIVVSYLANRSKGTLRSDDLFRLATNLKKLELAKEKGFI